MIKDKTSEKIGAPEIRFGTLRKYIHIEKVLNIELVDEMARKAKLARSVGKTRKLPG
jgi:hypothetical protein